MTDSPTPLITAPVPRKTSRHKGLFGWIYRGVLPTDRGKFWCSTVPTLYMTALMSPAASLQAAELQAAVGVFAAGSSRGAQWFRAAGRGRKLKKKMALPLYINGLAAINFKSSNTCVVSEALARTAGDAIRFQICLNPYL